MFRFFYLVCIALALAAPALLAQTPVLDSLKHALTTAREDTAKVSLLLQIAVELEGDPALSRKTAEEAYALAERLRDTRGQAAAMNLISYSHQQQGSYPEAGSAAEMALTLAERGGHTLERAEALRLMGMMQWRQGRLNAALDLYSRALPLFEALGDKKGMAATLSNIGAVYGESGNYTKSLDYKQQSLGIHEAAGNLRGQAIVLNNVGDVYMHMRLWDTAVAYFRRAYAINERSKNKIGMELNILNLGEAMTGLKNYTEARTMLERAITMASELNIIEDLAYIHRLFAELSVAEGKPLEGVPHALRAIALADSIGARPIKRDALQALSAAHEASGDMGAALRTYKALILLRDSIANDELAQKSAAIEAKSAAEKKDVEIKLLKKDAENQAIVRNAMAGGLTLFGTLVGVLVLSNNRRKKANALLQEQTQQLKELNLEKNEFLGIAAHDLRNPLSSIVMNAEMIKRYSEDMTKEQITEKLHKIIQTGSYMQNIIDNLLKSNAIESGKMSLDLEPLVPRSIISEVVDAHAYDAAEKQIEILCSIADDYLVWADYGRMREVVDNLLSNAIKYSPKGKKVWVSLLNERSEADGAIMMRFSVRDEGPGLTEDDKGRLFGKFARLSARPTGGESSTGLGLSIVKTMVEAMGGRVWCESDFGKGATFFVLLPTYHP